MRQRDRFVKDRVNSLLEFSEPFDIGIEKSVLRCILSDEGEKEIFVKLDAGCFYIPEHASLFEAARELRDIYGSVKAVPMAILCDRLQTTPDKLEEYFNDSSCFPGHIDYYVAILRQLKYQRAVIYESVELIAKAIDKGYNVDDLVDDCDGFAERVKVRGVMRMKDPNMEDWYAFDGNPSGEKYLVRKGKDGRSDYCLRNGKFVSEPAMLRQGFQRISIPKEVISNKLIK